MKKHYITILAAGFSLLLHAQGFDFSLSVIGVDEDGNYEIGLLAIPNFTETNGNSSDIGAIISVSNNVFLQPNGFENDCTFTPPNTTVCEYPIEADEWTAEYLTEPSNASTNRFVYQLSRTESGESTFFDAEAGTPLILAVFRVYNTEVGLPTTGDVSLINNNDSILDGTPNENFFNIRYPITTNGITADLFNNHDTMTKTINFATLSTPENSLDLREIKIYPNPTVNFITIEINEKVNTVEFYNMLGMRVLKTNRTQQISTQHLAKGLYLVNIETNRGTFVKKIVKE